MSKVETVAVDVATETATKVAKEAKEKAPKVKKEKAKKTIELPENNAAQHVASEELKAILSGGRKLTGAIKKIKATSLNKVREGFPAWLHLVPAGEGKAIAYIWDTREIVEIVDVSNLEDADYIGRIKDSGLPLIANGDIVAQLTGL